jgi:hypothetical protein
LEAPSQLFTADIQSAFMHLSSGRKESEVAYLNRARSNSDPINANGYYTRPDASIASNTKKSLLDPFIIKDIHLKLVIPKMVCT